MTARVAKSFTTSEDAKINFWYNPLQTHTPFEMPQGTLNIDDAAAGTTFNVMIPPLPHFLKQLVFKFTVPGIGLSDTSVKKIQFLSPVILDINMIIATGNVTTDVVRFSTPFAVQTLSIQSIESLINSAAGETYGKFTLTMSAGYALTLANSDYSFTIASHSSGTGATYTDGAAMLGFSAGSTGTSVTGSAVNGSYLTVNTDTVVANSSNGTLWEPYWVQYAPFLAFKRIDYYIGSTYITTLYPENLISKYLQGTPIEKRHRSLSGDATPTILTQMSRDACTTYIILPFSFCQDGAQHLPTGMCHDQSKLIVEMRPLTELIKLPPAALAAGYTLDDVQHRTNTVTVARALTSTLAALGNDAVELTLLTWHGKIFEPDLSDLARGNFSIPFLHSYRKEYTVTRTLPTSVYNTCVSGEIEVVCDLSFIHLPVAELMFFVTKKSQAAFQHADITDYHSWGVPGWETDATTELDQDTVSTYQLRLGPEHKWTPWHEGRRARTLHPFTDRSAVPSVPIYSIAFGIDAESVVPCGEEMMIRDGGAKIAVRLNPRIFRTATSSGTSDSNDTAYVVFVARVWNEVEFVHGKVHLRMDY